MNNDGFSVKFLSMISPLGVGGERKEDRLPLALLPSDSLKGGPLPT